MQVYTLNVIGVLRFFRVHLPRQFLHEASVISLIYAAEQEKISPKKEEKLRKEWIKSQDEKESPLQRLQRENKRLQERTIRLDFENDQVFGSSYIKKFERLFIFSSAVKSLSVITHHRKRSRNIMKKLNGYLLFKIKLIFTLHLARS